MSSVSCTQVSPPDIESSPGAPRAANSSSARTSRSTCSHQPEVRAATCPTASRARSSGSAASSSGAQQDAVGQRRDVQLTAVGVVAWAEHGYLPELQNGQAGAERCGGLLTGEAEQQRDLHVGRLSVGRDFQRGVVLVAVDEHEAGLTGNVTQRRHGGEQYGTVSTVDKWEAAR